MMVGRIMVAALAAALATAGLACAWAQEPVGDWHGRLAIPTGELRIGVTLRPKAGGGYEGSLASPDQAVAAIPLEEVRAEGGVLSFAIPRIAGSYEGRWDPDRKAWVGQWRQGTSLPLVLTAGKPDPLPVIMGLDGDWGATLAMPNGARLRLVLHVRTGEGGTAATLDSLDQLTYGAAVRPLAREGQTVRFTLPAATGATFEGILAGDGKSIAGTWAGARYKGPITFASQPVAAAQPRPQTPKPPFPYRTEEVRIDSAPGVKLAGSLTLPQGNGPFPAVVMITGSGAQDRDETILGHKPFAVIADRLTRDGIAVLRVDDRGFAKSMGDFATATDDDFAVDAAAQVAFLRRRADIDPARVGLIGHSEGGIVAPKVAAKDRKIAFIVLMAGPGMPLSDVLRAQREQLLPAMGQTQDDIRKGQALFDHVLKAMRGAKDEADARTRALQVIRAEGGETVRGEAQVQTMAAQLASRWMRDLLDYDPRPTLAMVTCPILALNGSKDGQVPAAQNLPAIRQATRGNPDVTIEELPGLNHLFQTATTGAVGEYADIPETIAPAALDAMSGWIRRHIGR